MTEVEAIKEATVLQAKCIRAVITTITIIADVIIEEIRSKGNTAFNSSFAATSIATDFGLLSAQIREHWEFMEKQMEGKSEPE